MKRFLALFFTTLVLSLSVAAQEHTRPPKSTPPPRAPNVPATTPGTTPGTTPSTVAPGWIKFTSDEGRFSVLMPGTPEDKVETTPSEHGPYTTHLLILRQPRNVFLIGWVDYDPSFNFNRQTELEMNRDNFVKGVSARLIETRLTRIDGYPALEFSAENANRIFRSRVYMVGRRPYQLVIGSPKGIDDTVNIDRFFNSFKISPY